jgi:uncharacterized protein YhfF
MSADWPTVYRNLPSWSFGDSPALADSLLALVLEGKKTATAGSYDALVAQGEAPPKPGERSIILNGQGQPICVIETTEVTLRRFDAVDAAFAFDEGEGDRSLAFWRKAHESYFRRTGTFATDMMVVCERFRLVAVPPREVRP